MMTLTRLPVMLFVIGFLTIGLYATSSAFAGTNNGFDLTGSLIPENQIFGGGPAKNGIPSIDQPEFISASDVRFLKKDDRILGIEIGGISRAYPIKIMNWHEIVNDHIDKVYFTVTYCPLCGTGMAFSAQLNNKKLKFGVSGLLYNSDVLLYDRETESLWSQIMAQAVTGQYKGTHLQVLALEHTTWSAWKQAHPDTEVLSTKTGYRRNYDRDPYQGYEKSTGIYFSVSNTAPTSYHPKERVLGVTIDGISKAYPFVELNKNGVPRFIDKINKTPLTVHWDQKNQSGFITTEQGQKIPIVQSYWFAWFTFHPYTLVYQADKYMEITE
jgi:hypothetical protein